MKKPPNTIVIEVKVKNNRAKPSMLKDHNHDLVHSLSEKNDALWRYSNNYLPTAKGCPTCTNLWKTLQQEDEKHVLMIVEEIKRHMDEGRFD